MFFARCNFNIEIRKFPSLLCRSTQSYSFFSLCLECDNILNMLKLILKTMRPRQWTKNFVILAGLVFDRQLGNFESLLRVLAAVLLFCLVSGLTYLVNDLLDLNADRAHPQKKTRPLASGRLPVKVAVSAAIILALLVFPTAFLLSFAFGLICVVYFLLMLAYSKWLKHMPIIDVMVIALGFVLRVSAGLFVITVNYFSPWLFVLTTLLALFLGFGKRRAELVALEAQAGTHRKALLGYSIPLLDQYIIIVLSATLITYCLYTFTAQMTLENHAMMFTIPFVLYGLLRYLFLLQHNQFGAAPEEVLLRDRPIQAAILLWGLSVIIVLYLL